LTSPRTHSLSLKATQSDPWQVSPTALGRPARLRSRHQLVPFRRLRPGGRGDRRTVHISEMAAHHVESPDQVVTAGEGTVVKIIELDTARPSHQPLDQQAAEGGEVSEEYREALAHTPRTTPELHRRPGVRRVHARDRGAGRLGRVRRRGRRRRLTATRHQSPRSRSSIPSTPRRTQTPRRPTPSNRR